jgi:hypothetical protein
MNTLSLAIGAFAVFTAVSCLEETFSSKAVRSHGKSKSAEYTNCCRSGQTAQGYTTHLGDTPGYRRGATGAAGDRAAGDGHKKESSGRFGSAATAFRSGDQGV